MFCLLGYRNKGFKISYEDGDFEELMLEQIVCWPRWEGQENEGKEAGNVGYQFWKLIRVYCRVKRRECGMSTFSYETQAGEHEIDLVDQEVKPQKRKKMQACGLCDGCRHRDDCGECAPCKNPRRKQKCLRKKCAAMMPRWSKKELRGKTTAL